VYSKDKETGYNVVLDCSSNIPWPGVHD